MAQLLAPWRVRVLAYDPYAEPARFMLANAERVDYETLLRESDVVSYHVVLTKETRYMCSDAQLALMKPNAFVINTARGTVVNEADLAAALANGTIRAAGLDEGAAWSAVGRIVVLVGLAYALLIAPGLVADLEKDRDGPAS